MRESGKHLYVYKVPCMPTTIQYTRRKQAIVEGCTCRRVKDVFSDEKGVREALPKDLAVYPFVEESCDCFPATVAREMYSTGLDPQSAMVS